MPAAAATAAATVVTHATPWTMRGAADVHAVGTRAPAAGRVDHEIDLARRDEVDRVDADLLADLRDHRVDRDPVRARASSAVPAVAAIANPSSAKRRAATSPCSLSRSASDRNTVPLPRQRVARAGLALRERHAERCGRCP